MAEAKRGRHPGSEGVEIVKRKWDKQDDLN